MMTLIDFLQNLIHRVLLFSGVFPITLSEQEDKDMIEAQHMPSWTCNRDHAAGFLGEEVIQRVVLTEVYVPSDAQLNQLKHIVRRNMSTS